MEKMHNQIFRGWNRGMVPVCYMKSVNCSGFINLGQTGLGKKSPVSRMRPVLKPLCDMCKIK